MSSEVNQGITRRTIIKTTQKAEKTIGRADSMNIHQTQCCFADYLSTIASNNHHLAIFETLISTFLKNKDTSTLFTHTINDFGCSPASSGDSNFGFFLFSILA